MSDCIAVTCKNVRISSFVCVGFRKSCKACHTAGGGRFKGLIRVMFSSFSGTGDDTLTRCIIVGLVHTRVWVGPSLCDSLARHPFGIRILTRPGVVRINAGRSSPPWCAERLNPCWHSIGFNLVWRCRGVYTMNFSSVSWKVVMRRGDVRNGQSPITVWRSFSYRALKQEDVISLVSIFSLGHIKVFLK